MDLSDKLPGFNQELKCNCCKLGEPLFFWLDSFWVEIYLKVDEDGKYLYEAYIDVWGDYCLSVEAESYHLANVAIKKIVNREVHLRRVFLMCNKFWMLYKILWVLI